MAKSRSSTPRRAEPRPARDPERGSRATVSLRIEGRTRQLIDEAAAHSGKSRTEFMIESARREALDVLLDRRLFELDSDRFDAFAKALDQIPESRPKLDALLRRVPAWRRS